MGEKCWKDTVEQKPVAAATIFWHIVITLIILF